MTSPKLISVNHMKSVYTANNPHPERKVASAGGLTVTLEGKDKERIVRDASSCYVESKLNEGKKTIFAPLDVNLDYGSGCSTATSSPVASW